MFLFEKHKERHWHIQCNQTQSRNKGVSGNFHDEQCGMPNAQIHIPYLYNSPHSMHFNFQRWLRSRRLNKYFLHQITLNLSTVSSVISFFYQLVFAFVFCDHSHKRPWERSKLHHRVRGEIGDNEPSFEHGLVQT